MGSIKKILLFLFGIFLFFSFSNVKSFEDITGLLNQQDRLQDPNSSDDDNIEKAIVRDVVDGDTIKVEFTGGNVETIRLLLIDTPESVKPNTPVQPFSEEAAELMRKKLIKGNVVEIEKGILERDKYDRLLAYVWVDGENVNKKLLENGFARVAYVNPPNIKYLDEFKEAEKLAKTNKKGVWSIEGYVQDYGFNSK
ncbi:thermonuclease family protein [Cytobacillus horneckiae]|uniref:Nuclease n=1 Tax=Cytobacillus horneckiae TaxID=549687 RepID=A0A2N0ZB18_9BACI|nr:thermonuclease family protein [Cytobacillus horneckiae]MEC1158705.1 thermonuclease family protein [Cytobacillus horneckiae]NRG46663.1 thermonuclease family protein [Bacillus sp. CRN 9]PKG26685.1 nuclease [Cytobacillus horneckiae]